MPQIGADERRSEKSFTTEDTEGTEAKSISPQMDADERRWNQSFTREDTEDTVEKLNAVHRRERRGRRGFTATSQFSRGHAFDGRCAQLL